LFAVTTVGGVCEGGNEVFALGGLLPKGVVVEVFLVAISCGVVDILYIHKNRYLFHND
jgi:hypothetical protein